ncbi:hypothetical protein MOF01_08200 [Bacillus spizizenii]|nr:hypothetical protein [Bacillus spizizenii]
MPKKGWIRETYSHEVLDIQNTINQIKNGHVHEVRPVPGNPTLDTVSRKLTKQLNELFRKIENEEPGDLDDLFE